MWLGAPTSLPAGAVVHTGRAGEEEAVPRSVAGAMELGRPPVRGRWATASSDRPAPGHDGPGASSSARAGPPGPATSRRPEADQSRVGRQGAGLLLTLELVPWRPAPLAV